MGRLAWMEALIPLGIIAGAITAIGGLMSLADQVTLGKPKGLGKDHWDRRLDYRDREVLRHPDKYGSSWQGAPKL